MAKTNKRERYKNYHAGRQKDCFKESSNLPLIGNLQYKFSLSVFTFFAKLL